MESLADFLAWPLFSIGDTQTTMGSLLAVVAVILATALVARLVRKALQGFFAGPRKGDKDSARGYSIVAQLLVWLVGIEIALHLLGLQLTTLFAASGFLALGAGFAVKNVVENFLSGGILRAEKTIEPGDLIIVNEKWLYIKRIGMRTVVALTYDGEEVLIPNSTISDAMVTNLTRHNRLHRIGIAVGVTYDSDLALVRKTLEATADKLEWRSTEKPPTIFLEQFGDSSINYAIDVWIDDANDSRSRKSDLHEAVWWALKDNNITIAFPQLDVHFDQATVSATDDRNI
jgi:small-conductance mechanosensitive channel